jgi:hypothetical protein
MVGLPSQRTVSQEPKPTLLAPPLLVAIVRTPVQGCSDSTINASYPEGEKKRQVSDAVAPSPVEGTCLVVRYVRVRRQRMGWLIAH